MSNHTPDGWNVRYCPGNNGHGVYRHELENGIVIEQHFLGKTLSEIRANVELMTSADVMLEALEEIDNGIAGGGEPSESTVLRWQQIARNAIAKAKGREPMPPITQVRDAFNLLTGYLTDYVGNDDRNFEDLPEIDGARMLLSEFLNNQDEQP